MKTNNPNITNGLEYIHEKTSEDPITWINGNRIKGSHIKIYEVRLPESGVFQGYRARVSYNVPAEISPKTRQIIKQAHTKLLEVVINGPSMSKAKEKINRAINREIKEIEYRERFTMPPAKGKRRPRIRAHY